MDHAGGENRLGQHRRAYVRVNRFGLGTSGSVVAIVLTCTYGAAFAASTTPSAPERLTFSAAAQDASGPTQTDAPVNSRPPFVRRSITAVRIETTEAPAIDADLSDAAWEKAAVIDDFTQRSPNPYEPASERTVVRILYDANNLYFAFYNYDSTPDQIVVRNKQRDGFVFIFFSVIIYLDPGQTRRNAYNFEIGASGGRTDQLELNNTEELREWDTIFEARARIVQDGWVAEFAIPFKSLSYEATQTTWGFDVARRIYHKNERVHWSGFNPALDFTDVSQSGDLVRDRERQPGHRARRADPRRATFEERLAARSDRRRIEHDRGWQRFLQGDARADQHADRESGFFRRTARHPPGQHHSVLTFHAGDPRFLSAGRCGVRIRRPQLQPQFTGPGLPTTVGRSSRAISASCRGQQVSLPVGEQAIGSVWRLRRWRIQRVDRQDAPPARTARSCQWRARPIPILAESKFGVVFTHGDPAGLTDNTVAGADYSTATRTSSATRSCRRTSCT